MYSNVQPGSLESRKDRWTLKVDTDVTRPSKSVYVGVFARESERERVFAIELFAEGQARKGPGQGHDNFLCFQLFFP